MNIQTAQSFRAEQLSKSRAMISALALIILTGFIAPTMAGAGNISGQAIDAKARPGNNLILVSDIGSEYRDRDDPIALPLSEDTDEMAIDGKVAEPLMSASSTTGLVSLSEKQYARIIDSAIKSGKTTLFNASVDHPGLDFTRANQNRIDTRHGVPQHSTISGSSFNSMDVHEAHLGESVWQPETPEGYRESICRLGKPVYDPQIVALPSDLSLQYKFDFGGKTRKSDNDKFVSTGWQYKGLC